MPKSLFLTLSSLLLCANLAQSNPLSAYHDYTMKVKALSGVMASERLQALIASKVETGVTLESINSDDQDIANELQPYSDDVEKLSVDQGVITVHYYPIEGKSAQLTLIPEKTDNGWFWVCSSDFFKKEYLPKRCLKD